RQANLKGCACIATAARHRCCRGAAHAEGRFRVRGRCGDCSRHGVSMKSFAVLVLLAVVLSCRLDTFFRGSGSGAPPVAGPPAGLRFTDHPQTTHARITLPPVRVAARYDQGNVVPGFGGAVALPIDRDTGGGPPGDTTTLAAP